MQKFLLLVVTSLTMVSCHGHITTSLMSILPHIPGLVADVYFRGQGAHGDHKYEFTPWSEFGDCSKVCGGGRRVRNRACQDSSGNRVVLENCYNQLPLGSYDLFTIVLYGRKELEQEEEICNKHECETSEWKLESTCTRECGGGTRTEYRICLSSLDQHKCNFQSKKLVPCNTNACFSIRGWSQWSNCNRSCGGGESTRRRKCEPKAQQNTALYNKLFRVINIPYSIFGLSHFKLEEDLYYFSQFLRSCSRLTQKKLCGFAKCPTCPKNQEYYHECLPCTRHCEAMSYNDITNFNFNLDQFVSFLAPSGCNGLCKQGCGCPTSSPFLGSNGICYQTPFLCPVNQLSEAATSHILLRLMTGQRSNRMGQTTESIATTSSLPATMSTTTRTTTPTTTTSTTTTAAAPTTADTTPSPAPTVAIEQRRLTVEKRKCPKDISILRHDYCICNGKIEHVPCVTEPGQQCPIICRDVPTCPSKLSPRMKNAPECSSPECDSDSECTAEGSLCCELLCGRRCLGMYD